MLQEFADFTHFVAIYAIVLRDIKVGRSDLLRYYIGEGSAQFITILHREGGVYRCPQNVLRNI